MYSAKSLSFPETAHFCWPDNPEVSCSKITKQIHSRTYVKGGDDMRKRITYISFHSAHVLGIHEHWGVVELFQNSTNQSGIVYTASTYISMPNNVDDFPPTFVPWKSGNRLTLKMRNIHILSARCWVHIC